MRFRIDNIWFSIIIFLIILSVYLIKDYLKRNSFFEKRRRDVKKYEAVRRPKSDFNINKILNKT